MASAPGAFASSGLLGRARAAAADHYAPTDVERAIGAERLDLRDVAALLSESAADATEALAQRARAVTLQRFGRAIRLFAPLYVSNACLSTCTYCGFSKDLEVARRTLTPAEVAGEARVLAARGFRSLLLVSGEHRREVSPEYLVECAARVATVVPQVAIETQTWDRATYARLAAAGVEGAVHYQETYDRERYAEVHRLGWKRDYDRRLTAVEEAGASGLRRIGIGVLLGLHEDWRADVLALAAHARWLQRTAWGVEVTVALPRMKPSAADDRPRAVLDDATYVRALCALRVALPDAGIVLSTRESPGLRDGLARICVTSMSAGSSTEPGGYSTPGAAQEQFSISDERTPAEVAAALDAMGYEPVWKDAFALSPSAEIF
ncbi:MAG TPA: 2-iminoacetate synthase ThiH [Mycobacteriales bacterium]|nr:2-iminoacetate synthase ThiH [Mycobacteriales bacterium]